MDITASLLISLSFLGCLGDLVEGEALFTDLGFSGAALWAGVRLALLHFSAEQPFVKICSTFRPTLPRFHP